MANEIGSTRSRIWPCTCMSETSEIANKRISIIDFPLFFFGGGGGGGEGGWRRGKLLVISSLQTNQTRHIVFMLPYPCDVYRKCEMISKL